MYFFLDIALGKRYATRVRMGTFSCTEAAVCQRMQLKMQIQHSLVLSPKKPVQKTAQAFLFERREWDLNPRMTVLQTVALGHLAIPPK